MDKNRRILGKIHFKRFREKLATVVEKLKNTEKFLYLYCKKKELRGEQPDSFGLVKDQDAEVMWREIDFNQHESVRTIRTRIETLRVPSFHM